MAIPDIYAVGLGWKEKLKDCTEEAVVWTLAFRPIYRLFLVSMFVNELLEAVITCISDG